MVRTELGISIEAVMTVFHLGVSPKKELGGFWEKFLGLGEFGKEMLFEMDVKLDR